MLHNPLPRTIPSRLAFGTRAAATAGLLSHMPASSLFDKLSHDQWMQIFNCLRTPLDARHVTSMARTCMDFRQLFQKLVTELRAVYDPFVQHQVDDYSDNADQAAFPPDLPAFDAAVGHGGRRRPGLVRERVARQRIRERRGIAAVKPQNRG